MTYWAIRRSSGETRIERSMRGGETCRHRRIGVGIGFESWVPGVYWMDSTESIPCSLLPLPHRPHRNCIMPPLFPSPLRRRRPGARDGARRQAPRPGRPRNHCSFGRRAPSHLRRETNQTLRNVTCGPVLSSSVCDETDGRANGGVLIASVLCRAAMQGCSSD